MPQTLSTVAIASNALNLLGENEITSFTDDSVRAKLCNRHFSPSRDQALEDFKPNFAKAYMTLAASVTSPISGSGWIYSFPLPADYIAMVEVLPEYTDYEIVSNHIYTNESSALVKYIYRQEDSTTWTPLFSDAVMYQLAYRIAPVLKASKREEMFEAYLEAKRLSKTIDSQEESSKIVQADDLITVRYRSGGGITTARNDW